MYDGADLQLGLYFFIVILYLIFKSRYKYFYTVNSTIDNFFDSKF